MGRNLNVFPNAKPKLLGAGEDSVGIIVTPAVAGLTGNVTAIPDAAQVNNIIGSTLNTFFDPRQNSITADQILVTAPSVTVAEGERVLITYVWVSDYNNNSASGGMTHELQRDGTPITTFNNSNYANVPVQTLRPQFIDNPGAGTFVYRIQQTDSSNLGGFQFINIWVNVIVITDTHAGFIQSVAIAGKQINTPDTHRTHEQSVLPG